ncbi:hypothetical protein [Pseudonocardia sp. ICBG1034]|uniref:hypothetical protein n=1 Tax=Pseudonocardia sp. ICBG1034 TaxID=2844381 RepID=UPI001CCF451D|nr:hypothetical protein [Pseudonocardia sp. ICBG1034]
MNDRYELLTPAQAVERLAAELPGGRADAEQVVASYLRDATGVHGRPSSGWRLDAFDLDDARARFGWVDFAHGETVAAARARADAATIAATRQARGTSAVTERARLEGLHSDAEMWGYRAHRVGLDELTNRTACDPQPRLVTVAREGRERSHREATAAHDARVLADEAATEAVGAAARCGHPAREHDLPDHDQHEEDPMTTPNDDQRDHSPDRPLSLGHGGRRARLFSDDDPGMRALREEMESTAERDAVEDERGDRERVIDEGPGSFAGGMWLTPDESAAGGVRPLTEAEVRRFSDLVRTSQAEAVADQIDPVDSGSPGSATSTDADSDGVGWAR